MTARGSSCLACLPPPSSAMMHPVVVRRVTTPVNKKIFFMLSLYLIYIVFSRDVTRRTATSPWGLTLSSEIKWGKHPMAATRFSCFPLFMADQSFFHHLRSAEYKPLRPRPDRIAIQPQRNEDVAETVPIRLECVPMATRFCRISLKPIYRQEHGFQLVLGSRCKRIFASGLERRAN